MGADGAVTPAACIFDINVARTIKCGEPVWEGQFCLPHYIRKSLYLAGLLRPPRYGKWKSAREKQTYQKERNSITIFFQSRLRSVRDGDVEPVATFGEAYAVMDQLWDACGLNRRQPLAERVAKFVSFISRQDYIAKHGWYNRDWVGDKGNIGLRRKEARNAEEPMGPDQALQANRVRRSEPAQLGPSDAMVVDESVGLDPLDDWETPSRDKRLPDGGA